jgi:hypothetical protein
VVVPGELAGRRKHRLLFRHDFQDLVFSILHLEYELTVESLVVLLAQHLFTQRKVVPFRHFESFEGLDQLHGILAPTEARLLHAELERVHGLEVRVNEAVWKGA